MVLRGESRAGMPISLIIVHTNEGPHGVGLNPDHTAEDLAAYLDRANAEGDWKSYHLICDDDSVVRYVPDSEASWSALAANMRSLNICFTGWAAWPRSEWLAHDRMLRLGAVEVAKWSKAYGIPARKLTPAQVGLDLRGICGHWDWTLGKRNGTHTDPGPNFPWDLFISYMISASPEDTMPWRLDRTPSKMLSKAGDHPASDWAAVEDVIALPGPAGGWRGRILTHTVFGYGGAFIQEAWWGGLPSPVHVVKPSAPAYAPAFLELVWEAPTGARWLTIRYAAPAGGSIGIETEH
jgi:N-acetylmuramoyl-L-alanine amidase